MFYELETLENQLKCPICLRKFNSPRILPCGKSVCLTCIEELSKLDEKESTKSLSCPICQKNHPVPNEGFILNEFILNTLQLKPQKVYRCPSYEKFDHLLAKIREELAEIEEKLERPSDKIVEYCDRLRNQIDIRTEVLIEKLNSCREGLLGELKAYEQKCLKNNSITAETRKTLFEKSLKDIGHKLTDHHKYLNQARIDEVAVKKMFSEAKINEFNLTNYSKLVDSKLFGASLIRFECNAVESVDVLMRECLGRLSYEELKLSDEKILNPDKLTQIRPEKTIECRMAVDLVKELDSKYIVSSENCVKIFENDSPEATAEIRFDQNPECLLTNGRDLILVQHTRNIWKNNRKEKSNFSSLSVYDLSLTLKSEISVDFTIGSCCSSSHSIFVQSDRTMLITVLNWSLEKITSFGQIHFPEKPYFFRDSTLRFVKDDRIYLKKTWSPLMNGNEMTSYQINETNTEDDNGFIRIVSLTNGELISQYSLSLRDEYFIIDGLMRTIVIDAEDSWLRIYDKPKQKVDKAELIYEREVDGLKDVSDIRVTQDGRLCFIQNKRYIQYISLYS